MLISCVGDIESSVGDIAVVGYRLSEKVNGVSSDVWGCGIGTGILVPSSSALGTDDGTS